MDEDSSRRISALELLATAVYVKMLITVLASAKDASGTPAPTATALVLPGSTDNLGNRHILARLYTKRWPGAAVLMEIARDLLANDISVDVEFTRREDNTWSDALANGNCHGFDPTLRYNPDLTSEDYWHVLPLLLKLGTQMGMHLSRKRKGTNEEPLVTQLRNPAR